MVKMFSKIVYRWNGFRNLEFSYLRIKKESGSSFRLYDQAYVLFIGIMTAANI